MKRTLEWIASLIGIGADGLSQNHQNDPVYKKNVQRLIERNQQFEEESKNR